MESLERATETQDNGDNMTDIDLNDQDLPDTGNLDSYTTLPYNPAVVQDDAPRKGIFGSVVRMLTTIRTWASARSWALGEQAHASENWSGLCQKFARSCVNAAAWATSALNAWNSTPASHRHSGAPRGGSLVYFGTQQPGHVVFVDPLDAAYCFSTDILRPGKVDRVPIKLITERWGLAYRGWIDWTPSGSLNLYPLVTDPLHTIRIGGRTPLQKSEVIRQSGMSTDRFDQHNSNFPPVAPAGYKVVVPATCAAIYAGRDHKKS